MAVHAPEFAPAKAWINTDAPIRLRDLRGHIVVVDFWTSCCINCLHVLPVLRDLEARFAHEPVVVIGVHSGKFAAEDDPDRVAEAVARHHVTHPVVVDDAFGIWERFAVRSWPTLVVLKPDGTVASVAPGEPDAAVLDAYIRRLLDESRANGTLTATPRHFTTAGRTATLPSTTLSFPGKVAVGPGGRIAIADTGHHRVVLCDARGAVERVLGSGARGLVDGDATNARFDAPQGLTFHRGALWVADTENHALRRIDLNAGTVSTVAGTGAMGTLPQLVRSAARETPLRSPWDLVWVNDDTLVVAMAGTHQLVRYTPSTETVEPWLGSGREALVDAPGIEAALAQPSGLALAGTTLYLADSETSAVRAVDVETRAVRTLVGLGLFDFGDVDGSPETARLQHPLDVAHDGRGHLLVADTYNDRLKRVDLATGETTSFGDRDARFLHEPGGLTMGDDGTVLVADTGHHRVVRLGADGALVEVLALEGLRAPVDAPDDAGPPTLRAGSGAGSFFVAGQPLVVPGALGVGRGTLGLDVVLPPGWKFAEGSRRVLALEVSRRSDLLDLAATTLHADVVESDVRWAAEVAVRVERLPSPAVQSELLATLSAVLCSEADGVCVPVRAWFRVALTLEDGALTRSEWRLPVEAPRGL